MGMLDEFYANDNNKFPSATTNNVADGNQIVDVETENTNAAKSQDNDVATDVHLFFANQDYSGNAKTESNQTTETNANSPTVYGRINPAAIIAPSEAAAKGKRGAVESAALERAAETGQDNDYDGTVLGSIASGVKSFATSATGGVFSKSANNYLQSLARGVSRGAWSGEGKPLEEMPDSAVDYMLDQTGVNGLAGIRSWFGGSASHAWRGKDNIMRQWDESEGLKYKNEAERKKARVEYAKELARGMLGIQEETKLNAESELAGREETTLGAFGRGLIQQGGYTAGYVLGAPVAGTLEGGARAAELMSDKTKVNERGEIVADAERDSFGTALAKGAARGVVAPLVELVGGKLVTTLGGKAISATIGKIPLVKSIGGRISETATGKAVATFANKFNRLGRVTGMGSFPEEMVEEWEDQVLDAMIGLDRRESEKEGTTALGRAAESSSQFFTKDNLAELAKSMVLMQVLQSGAANAIDRHNSRRVDAILEHVCLVDKDKLKDWTANQKQQAFTAWVNGLSEKDVQNMVDGGSSALDRLVSDIRGGRNLQQLAGRRGVNAVVAKGRGGSTAEQVNEVLGEINASVGSNDFVERDADGNAVPRRFAALEVVGTDGKATPAWTDAQDEAGDNVKRLHDAQSGVTIDRYGADRDAETPEFTVYDSRGRRRSAQTYEDAVKRADEMAADSASRNAKLAYIDKLAGGVLRNQQVFVGDTITDIRRQYDAKYGAGKFDENMAAGDGQYLRDGSGGVTGASFWVPPTDADGNSTLVQERDAQGNPVFVKDENGNDVPKMSQQRAVFFTLDGTNDTITELNSTAYHEVARHSGLAKMYTKDEKRNFLKRLTADSFGNTQGRETIAKIVEDEMKFRGIKSESALWKDADAVEEVFARVTETMVESPSIKQKFMANVYRWYRDKYKSDLDIQPDELAVVVDELNRFAREGGGTVGSGGVEYENRERRIEADANAMRKRREENENYNAEVARLSFDESRKADLLSDADKDEFKEWLEWQGARDTDESRIAFLYFMNGRKYVLTVKSGGVVYVKAGEGTEQERAEFEAWRGERAENERRDKTFADLKAEEDAQAAALPGERKARKKIDREAEKNRIAAEKERAKFAKRALKDAKANAPNAGTEQTPQNAPKTPQDAPAQNTGNAQSSANGAQGGAENGGNGNANANTATATPQTDTRTQEERDAYFAKHRDEIPLDEFTDEQLGQYLADLQTNENLDANGKARLGDARVEVANRSKSFNNWLADQRRRGKAGKDTDETRARFEKAVRAGRVDPQTGGMIATTKQTGPNARFSINVYAEETGDRQPQEFRDAGHFFVIPNGLMEYRKALANWKKRKDASPANRPTMAQFGVVDPMADWIDNFLDGATAGQKHLLFGFGMQKGANDGYIEDALNRSPIARMIVEQNGGIGDSNAYAALAEAVLEANSRYSEWRDKKVSEDAESRAVDNERKESEAVWEASYDDLAAAHDAQNAEWESALGEIESADAFGPNDEYLVPFNRSNLTRAKRGDIIRLGNSPVEFMLESYDAESGVLTIADSFGEDSKPRMFKVTENEVKEIDDGRDSQGGDQDNAGDAGGKPEGAGSGGSVQGGGEGNAQGGNAGSADNGLTPESVTPEQIEAERKRREQKAAIAERLAKPLKGNGPIEQGQTLLDLGGAEGGVLFNRVQRSGETAATTPTDAGYAAWAVGRDGKPLAFANERDAKMSRALFDMLVRKGRVDGNTGLPITGEASPTVGNARKQAENATQSATNNAGATQSASSANAPTGRGTPVSANPANGTDNGLAELEKKARAASARLGGNAAKSDAELREMRASAERLRREKIVGAIDDLLAYREAARKKEVETDTASDSIKNDESTSSDFGVRFRRCEDKKIIDEFNDETKTITLYRAVKIGPDSSIRPPQSSRIKDESGKYVEREPEGYVQPNGSITKNKDGTGGSVVMQADERFDLAYTKKNKSGTVVFTDKDVRDGKCTQDMVGTPKYYFDLKKGSVFDPKTGKKLKDGGSTDGVVYDPYGHFSDTPFNDQFSSAWRRPDWVVIRVKVLKSDLESGYRAKGAGLTVGPHPWNGGAVDHQLPSDMKRNVYLSRYWKLEDIVTDREAADILENKWGGLKDSLEIPDNRVTPGMREEMARRGFNITESGEVDYSASGEREGVRFRRVTPAEDAAYMDAVKRGDIDTAQRMVREAAEKSGYVTDSSYQGTSAFNGAAPSANGYFANKDERKAAWDDGSFEDTQTFGDYIFDGINIADFDFILGDERYRRNATPERREAVDNMRGVLSMKGKTIRMYRSVPSDVEEVSFRNGDWITPSRSYAEENARIHGWGDDYRIIEQDVSVEDIWWDGNDIAEWGYDDGKNYSYRNTRNNRKLLDAVTYDDAGNVIPLSQRFNHENPDIRFRRALTYTDGKGILFNIQGADNGKGEQVAVAGENDGVEAQDALGNPAERQRGLRDGGAEGDGVLPRSFYFENNKIYKSDKVRDLFRALNSDGDSDALAGKVFETAKRLGVKFAFGNTKDIGGSEGSNGIEWNGRVMFNTNVFGNDNTSDQFKANIILHEAIHSITSYAINIADGKADGLAVVLPKKLNDAVDDLRRIYESTKETLSKTENGEYGAKNLHEFAAELSKPYFRNELKKIGLWNGVLKAIAKIVSAVTGKNFDNSLNMSLDALDRIMDNADAGLYGVYSVPKTSAESYVVSKTWRDDANIRFRRYAPDPSLRYLADALNLSPRETDALVNSADALDVGGTRRDSMPSAERELVDAVSDERGIRAAYDTSRNLAGKLFGRDAGEKWHALKRGLERRLLTYLEPVINMTRFIERKTLRRVKTEDNVADAAKFAVSHQTRMWEDADRGIIKPLYKEIADNKLDARAQSLNGGTLFDELLLALHGPAFNRMISERTDGRTKDGSGASTAFWLSVLRKDGANGTDAELLDAITRGDYAGLRWTNDSIGAKAANAVALVRRLNDESRDVLEKSGRLSKVQRQTWEKLSPFYVPMRFDQDAGDNFMKVWLYGGTVDGAEGYTKNYTAPESRHAFGHRSVSESPVAFSIQQFSTAIQRATDNDVRAKLAKTVRANPFLGEVIDPKDPAQAARLPHGLSLGQNTKTISTLAVNALEQNDNVVAFKENGDTKFIVLGPKTSASGTGGAEDDSLSEAEARLVGKAIKKTSLANPNGVVKVIRKFTRAFAVMRTTLSPEFLVSNFLADNAQAAGNLYSKFGAGGILKFEKNVIPALLASIRHERGKASPATNRMDRYVDEWRRNGGLIGGLATEAVADINKSMEREIAKFAGNKKVKLVDFVMGIAERLNKPFEQASRIASYVVCRENGMSEAEAAKFAREVTVDFNQKGEWGPILNSIYAFSNAALVDMGRSFEAFGDGKAQGRAIGYGVRYGTALVTMGLISSMLGFWQDDPDDEREGKTQWKDTKDYVKQNKLGARIGQTFLSVPIRGINRELYYAGHKLYEVLTGRTSVKDAALDTGLFAVQNAVDPIGDASKPAQAIAPSVARPAVELMQNENFTGAQIHRQPMNPRTDVRSEMGRATTPKIWRDIAKSLNSITGGNRNKRGLLDAQPEVYQHLFSWLTGSVGNDAARAANLVNDIVTGDFSDMNVGEDAGNFRNVPFVRRVMSGLQGNSVTFRDKIAEYTEDKRQFEDVAKEDEAVMADLRARHPYYENTAAARRWRQELADLDKAQKKMMKVEMSTEGDDRKAARELRMKIQAAFVRRMEVAPGDEDAERRWFDRQRERETAKVLAQDKRRKELEKRNKR